MKYLILILLFVVSCGKDYSSESIPFPTNPGSGGSSGGSGSDFGRGSVTQGPTRFNTSTGGFIESNGQFSLSLTSGEYFEGFSASQEGAWLLSRKSVSYNEDHWILRLVGNNSASIRCSFIYSSPLEGGLAVDSTSFYIRVAPYYGQVAIRRFSLQTCADQGYFLSPLNVSTYGNLDFSIENGKAYFPKQGAYGSSGQTGLGQYTPGSSLLTVWNLNLAFGTHTLDWLGYNTHNFLRNGIAWATSYSYSNYQTPYTLWKVSGSGVMGVAEFSVTNLYSTLTGIALDPSGTKAYLHFGSYQNTVIQIFDVSGF